MPPAATLFIVPADAAGIRSGSACAIAPQTTSTMRWLVSTLPAATATGGAALTTDRAGSVKRSGRNSPALVGAPTGSRQRST